VTEPRVIAALDPGLTHVGLGIVGRYGAKLDLVWSQHIKAEANVGLETPEAKRIDLNRRLKKIWREVAMAMRDYRPSLLGIEDQAPATIGARMQGLKAAALGEKAGGFSANNDPVFEVVGIAKACAFAYGIPVLLYTPQQAKIAVCGKGNGNASKGDVIKAIRYYFPGIEADGQVLREHEADAIAGAIYCERVTLLDARRAARRSA
jgi:Holliday junction resolvasome RuvABC endonuclease subunit